MGNLLRFKLKERMAEVEFRERRHLTLQEISEATGIGRMTLSRVLNHASNARADTIDKLCAYFDCRIEDLVEYIPDHEAP